MCTTTAAPAVRAMPLSGTVDRFKTDPAYQGYTLCRCLPHARPLLHASRTRPRGGDRLRLADAHWPRSAQSRRAGRSGGDGGRRAT